MHNTKTKKTDNRTHIPLFYTNSKIHTTVNDIKYNNYDFC